MLSAQFQKHGQAEQLKHFGRTTWISGRAALIIANTNRSYGPFAASNLFAFMPAIIICPKCSNAHFDDCQCKCYWRKATDVARELRAWPDKFRVEAAELRKVNTPKATGGAIVYEDIADALDRLLKANASDQATARK